MARAVAPSLEAIGTTTGLRKRVAKRLTPRGPKVSPKAALEDFDDPNKVVGPSWVIAAAAAQVAQVAEAGKGERDNALNSAAHRIGRLAHLTDPEGQPILDLDGLRSKLRAATEANGLLGEYGGRKINDTIERGITAGQANPLEVEVRARPPKLGLGDDVPEALRQRAANPDVEREVQRITARREAAAIVAELDALASPRPAPDIGRLDDVLERSEAERWLIHDLLPAEGNMLVVAQRKTGKTTLVGNLVRSLLTGEPFLGRFAVEAIEGTVMMLNYEVSGGTFARWLADMGLPKKARKRIVIVNLRGRENLLATEAGRAELAALMREHRVEVLTVDPFGKAFTGDNQDSNSQVTPWLASLDRVATEGGAKSVLLVAHAGWGGDRGQATQVRARGASALEDWADSIVRYSRADTDGQPRFIEAEGRDVLVDSDRLEYDAATRLLTATGLGGRAASRKAAKASVLEAPILAIVRGMPGITAGLIATALREQELGFRSGDHSAAIAALVDRGELARFKDGRNFHHYLPENVPAKFSGHTTTEKESKSS